MGEFDNKERKPDMMNVVVSGLVWEILPTVKDLKEYHV